MVEIPKSYRAPHQAPDKRYYKRFNFQSVPMEDYEINDVRSRQRVISPLVNIDIEVRGKTSAYLVVANIGKVPAQDLKFTFSKPIKWRTSGGTPTLFARGAKYLPPGRSFRFFYNFLIRAFNNENEIPSNFDVEASYLHPEINQTVTDTFHVDLIDYMYSTIPESELSELGKHLKDSLKELTNQVSKLNNHLDEMTSISSATGLDISIQTLKNLGHILAGDGEIERIDPTNRRAEAFKQLLDIDDRLAYELQGHFMSIGSGERLEDLQGMTNEILTKLKKYFIIDRAENI